MWFGDIRGKYKALGIAIAVAALLSGCQTSQGPSAEELAAAIPEGFEAAGFKQDESLRVRFQPPIGNSKPVRAELAENASLELVIFNLDPESGDASGDALGPAISTAGGKVTFADGIYSAAWDVSETASAASGPYVRVEIRPAGIPHEQVCNDPWGACLGYFDARIVSTGGQQSHSTKAASDVSAAAGMGSKNTLTVPDHKTLQVDFKLLAGTAAAPESTAALVSLGGSGSEFDDAGNCASNDFSLPGQGLQAVGAGLQAVGAGLQAVGAVGGLFLADPALTSDGVGTTATVGGQVRDHVQLGYHGNVAILVVDDFHGVYDLPSVLLTGADIDYDDLQALLAGGALSHGSLVFHQLKQLAEAATADGTPYPGTPNASSAKYQWSGGSRLLIQAVDAAGLDTDDLALALTAAVDDLPHHYQRVVVNMSFAIVPCAVVDDVASTVGTGAIPNFEAYVASLLQVNAIAPQDLDELGKLTAQPTALSSDPFFKFLACPLPSVAAGENRCDGKTDSSYAAVKTLVHVAASGNFGNGYALYPAALPTVISVGSLDVTGAGYSTSRSGFSNAATVLAPGALYHLATKDTQEVVYGGTSFAAPVVSLFAALDLASYPSQCDAGNLRSEPIVPHSLASTELHDQPLLSPFLGSEPTAVSQLCD